MVHRLPGCAIVCDAEGRRQGRCSVTVSAIARQIWDMKYRLKQPDGTAVDRTVQDSWRRVAAALAARSEEHTSELQSLMRISYAGLCLKKQIHTQRQNTMTVN